MQWQNQKGDGISLNGDGLICGQDACATYWIMAWYMSAGFERRLYQRLIQSETASADDVSTRDRHD